MDDSLRISRCLQRRESPSGEGDRRPGSGKEQSAAEQENTTPEKIASRTMFRRLIGDIAARESGFPVSAGSTAGLTFFRPGRLLEAFATPLVPPNFQAQTHDYIRRSLREGRRDRLPDVRLAFPLRAD